MRISGPQEYGIIVQARLADPHTIAAVSELHHAWKQDSEIAERLGLDPMMVWHTRTWHDINRHNRQVS